MGEAKRNKVSLADKLEAMVKRQEMHESVIKALSVQTMQSFGSTYANQKALESFIEKLDMNDRAFRFILFDIYGHLQHVNTIVGIVSNDPGLSDESKARLASIDLEEMKTQAREWLERVAAKAFEVAEGEKAADEAANKEFAKKQREEAAAAELAKAEAVKQEAQETDKKMEDALKDAELKNRMAPAGGEGSAVPEGAFVFGG